LFVLVGAPSIATTDSVSATLAQEVKPRDSDIAEIMSIWSGYLAAAQAGDIESALEFFNPIERNRRREIFDSMGEFFPDYVNDMIASEFSPIEISDEVALFALTPPCEEIDTNLCETHPIYFVNHPDLGWRLSKL
jgi:hypothetical protein